MLTRKERRGLARKAGQVTSLAKAASSRSNGRLGGRPRNPEIKRIMRERGVSRQRAWVIARKLTPVS